MTVPAGAIRQVRSFDRAVFKAYQRYFVSRFPADINNLKNVIEDILSYYYTVYDELDDSSVFEFRVVLNELLINAIKHGGRQSAECFIKVVAGISADGCALIIIEDGGEGYDTASVCKCDSAAVKSKNVEEVNETGRGIFIVKKLCDDFMVNEKGNKVVINKTLSKSKINI